MSRKNVTHTPATLQDLAKKLAAAAKKIENAAAKMRSAKVKELSLAHQAPIDEGLKAAERFVLEAEHKIRLSEMS